ncbi:M81 family metallopeptidase [Bradyrhizobium sp. LHD-71]|uniref:M81 family metallopeptidase n=1 Tax=Bradyrhizobium sp. LHD-71 TaxID=3072141 RepID=UPI00280E5251|nr:M81 family metallopeptidase [Bradyrhizobium sp. LHD-71]MDQ8730942.1 M81 family metallopeptidase [Bradyrhizobium sp. LHD-71]
MVEKRRLAVARFWYEGNSFSPVLADRAAFERREWLKGQQALERTAQESELRAVIEFADRHPDWDVEVFRCASASPAGQIDDEIFTAFLEETVADLTGRTFDAIYLSLHGAGVTTRREDPEVDLLRAIRKIQPNVPIGASFDLHGNLSNELADHLTTGSVYRTYPHIDMRETAWRVLSVLERTVAGEVKPVCRILNGGLLLPSFNMRTKDGPMRELQEFAAACRKETGVLEATVFGGFPFANTPGTGGCALVVTDGDPDKADRIARTLGGELKRRQPEFMISLPTAAAGVARALASNKPGLLAVTDPGDNPYSGGINDTPEMFRALVAAQPNRPVVFAAFTDADIVDKAWRAGVGKNLGVVEFGGKAMKDYGAPVKAEATVVKLTDGVFRNIGPMETGIELRCGRTALLQSGNISIIVTEFVAPANDPAFFHLHGVDIENEQLLFVKAKNHFRAAFDAICSEIIDIDAPGPACLDMTMLPFIPELKARIPA